LKKEDGKGRGLRMYKPLREEALGLNRVKPGETMGDKGGT